MTTETVAVLDKAQSIVGGHDWPTREQFVDVTGWERLDIRGFGKSRRLLIAAGGDDLAVATSLAYSAEVPLLLAVTSQTASLVDVLRWDTVPGDVQLAQADLSVNALVDLLRWTAPDPNGQPGALAESARTVRHPHLAPMLAKSLAELRAAHQQVAALQGRTRESRDVDLLQTFHRILFIRFFEDRHPQAEKRLAEIAESRNAGQLLDDVISEFRERFDSTFFESPAVSARDLPDAALREVLRQTSEPWTKLNLDFSVTDPDVAGRLYQSYLQMTPTQKDRGQLWATTVLEDQQARFGAYYTPPAVAEFIAERALLPWLERYRPQSPAEVTVIDPACGSGAFLLSAMQILRRWFRDNSRRLVSAEEVTQSLVGVDIDAGALQLARLRLLESVDLGDRPLPELRLLPGDALGILGDIAIDWPGLIGEGRPAIVLSNPPFGAQGDLAGANDERSRGQRQRLYPHTYGHNSDLAFSFAELAVRLSGDAGAVGILLPRTALSGTSGEPLRTFLRDRVAAIGDFRATRFFEAQVQTCALILSSHPDAIDLFEVRDSRIDPAQALSGPAMRVDLHVARECLSDVSNWSIPAILARRDGPLFLRSSSALESKGRTVTQGPQVGSLNRYLVPDGEVQELGDGMIRIRACTVPARRAPKLVRSGQLRPFQWQSTHRLVLPFNRSELGPLTGDTARLVTSFGPIPRNAQPGKVGAAVGAKVVIRAFAREPAAVADANGVFVVTKGTGGGLNISGQNVNLSGAEALLNSALYQWMLRGTGTPRGDETVELKAAHVGQLPWPDLTPREWTRLAQAGDAVRMAIESEDAASRVGLYWTRRVELDFYVFDILEVPDHVVSRVRDELIREG